MNTNQPKIEVGDVIKCINNAALKDNDYKPKLDLSSYKLLNIKVCPKCGQEHYDVGLISELNYISCYTCKQAGELTIIEGANEIGSPHYCHPLRFIKE